MARQELTTRCFISINGAEPVPWESLTPEELESAKKSMSERLSRNMSAYFSQHMDEFIKL